MSVIPVKTGIQTLIKHWIPASAGMTNPEDLLYRLFFQRAKISTKQEKRTSPTKGVVWKAIYPCWV
jgi:hypothetical protein